MGSWFSYGLGTENQQLPSYITILPREGERNYSSAFLPAIHQGTTIQSVGSKPNQAPIRHLTDRSISESVQRRRIDLIQEMNRRQLERLDPMLAETGRRGLFRAVLIHHPPLPGSEKWRKRLTDATQFCSVLRRRGAEMVRNTRHRRDRAMSGDRP